MKRYCRVLNSSSVASFPLKLNAASPKHTMPTEERLNKFKRVAAQRQAGITLVIEDVFDPHNLGAIARSCDAFGIQEINIIFETHAEFDPKEVGKNSSTATNKWLSYRVHQDTKTALRALKDEGWLIVATAIDPGAESIFEADLSQARIALLLGNEKDGLSATALGMADRKVSIPMQGIAQSMNVSVSAALFIYEITRQRRQHGLDAYMPDAENLGQTFDYFLEMHEHLNRRNKRARKERARERLSQLDVEDK